MAVYEVESPDGKLALVECRTKNAAINHIASKGYKAKTLSMSEVVKRVKAGTEIETLVEEEKPVPAEKPAPLLDAANAEAQKAPEQKDPEPKAEELKDAPRKSTLFQKKTA